MHGLSTVSRRWCALACVLALSLVAPPAWALAPGDTAPAFRLLDLGGQTFVASDSLLGLPESTLLVFWNTGCPDCLGDVVATASRPSATDTCAPRIIGICTDRERIGDARRFAAGVGLEIPMLWDRLGSVAASYGAGAVSYATVLVDARGIVELVHTDHPESIDALLERIWRLACHPGSDGGTANGDEAAGADEP